ncbi:MAG TPA: HAMP domain-containing sensor histidine kinase [Rectinemataceae bacterium]|nr:HAMP domain-containing sensor histidine kinase [Rectinemataceae bacterium]
MSERTANTRFLKSSHFRVALWYTALIGALSIAFGTFIYLNQVREIYGDSRFRVSKGIGDLIRALDRGQEITLRSDEAFAVIGADGKVLRFEGVDEKEALSLAAAAASASSERTIGGDARQGKSANPASFVAKGNLLYGFMSLERPEGFAPGGHLLYGAPLDPYGLRGKLLLNLVMAIVLMLAAAMLSGIWLAKRSMKPVSQIARTAKSIGEGDLSRRIRLGTNDELGEISSVFDEMLDRLEASFARQKRFVADAGHELRTPLSIIMLETERSLTSKRSQEEYRQSLSSIRAEGVFMSKLVEDLLTLARADGGGIKDSWKPVDLADVVLEAVEHYAPVAAAKGAKLSVGELPEVLVFGDRKALVTVVGNLLDNAVKYGRGEGGRVGIRLESRDGVGRILVSDDGLGISPDKIGKIFDRFFRADEARTEGDGVPAGSGLGLAIAKATVDAHGGRIEVESEAGTGTGTEFLVTLPLNTNQVERNNSMAG